jgi:hypothetical protein
LTPHKEGEKRQQQKGKKVKVRSKRGRGGDQKKNNKERGIAQHGDQKGFGCHQGGKAKEKENK